MMNLLQWCLLIFKCVFVLEASVIVNRYDDSECMLDDRLVKEIESYKNVGRNIMDKIINEGYGHEMYKQYTNFIDKYGPRPSGSDVLEKAIDHMMNLTVENGLNNVIFEEETVPHWHRQKETGQMLEPIQKTIPILGLYHSVVTPAGGITAEVIVIKSFDELKKIDEAKVKKKIVVYDADYISYGETVAYRVNGASEAAKKGAVASLIRSVTPFSLYTLHTGYQYYQENITKIPTACITIEDAEYLRRLQEKGEKIVLNIEMSSTFDMTKSRNTIVDLKGQIYPEKQVIVSGHIDSWDVGTGAIDDGGGMMISWFSPVILNKLGFKPKRTLRAILWTSEEPGLIGAQAYLKRHMNELDKIIFIMESDEGTFKPLGLEVAGSQEAVCIIKKILAQFSPIDKLKVSHAPGSDITIFISKGVPGASLTNENERYYWYHHSDADTLIVQNKKNVIECAAFWAAVSYVIADLSIDIPRK